MEYYEGRGQSGQERERRWHGNLARIVIPWMVALVIAAAIVVPSELNRRHFHSHHLSVRIFAGVLIALAFAAALRLLIFIGQWLAGYGPRSGRTSR